MDVTDEQGVRALVQDITQRHGPISGVVHGAGIIEDKLLADKASDSWSRVVETKIIGLLLLQKYLDPQALKFFTVFSSGAGRYGNSGQSDYACANELMNRLCVALQCALGRTRRGQRLVLGTVGRDQIRRGHGHRRNRSQVRARRCETGFCRTRTQAVPRRTDAHGRHAGRGRLRRGGVGYARSGARRDPLQEGGRLPKSAMQGGEPLLGAGGRAGAADRRADRDVDLDRARHLYLDEHMLDGKQVLPAAAALEMMAEAGRMLWPGWQVAEVREHKLMKGVEMESRPRSCGS